MEEITAVQAVLPAVETRSPAVSPRTSSLLDADTTPKAALPPSTDEEDTGTTTEANTDTTRADTPTLEPVTASVPKPVSILSPEDPGTATAVKGTVERPRAATPETTLSSDVIDGEHSTPVSESSLQPVFVSTTTLHDPSLDYLSSPVTPTDSSPPAHVDDSSHTSPDSLTSVTLSPLSPPEDQVAAQEVDDAMATPRVNSAKRHLRKISSLDILQNKWSASDRFSQSTLFDNTSESPLVPMSAMELDRPGWTRESIDLGADQQYKLEQHRRRETNSTMDTIDMLEPGLDTPALTASRSSIDTMHRASGSSSEEEQSQVDWSALDKTEEQEKEDKSIPQGAEDESTAFLLARLEQENAKFALDPKAASSKSSPFARARAASRPPSMAHLKKLVADRDAPSIRYSMASDVGVPAELPPMTELEFWAALVQDYPSTAVRLPTLTTTKIRSGIPLPLRGVVWISMAGARDKDLEDAFDRLVNEKSPYEGIINKDVGRSFPGVELFRDAEGEGQKMLGRVLKCFSLQDKDIGYCQGLGFLVGPLLMNMGEREAFCVLVRLMDHYSLRPSFLPSLSGLHMRIYQFSALLKQHHAKLHDHLAELGIEPAYLSQWFLSCFAVTCPLPMLFRIYDVIFAEGANETVMRVALALMRRHEEKMLGTTEFEEVMQLLLGRELWDCYGSDADELVDDFTSLGDIVTFARLAELEKEFNNKSSESVGQSAGFLPDVQAAAGRFLGRLWAPGHAATPSKPVVSHAPAPSVTTLSPQSAEKEAVSGGGMNIFGRPSNFLRRSPSKQSINLATDSSISDDSTSTMGSGAVSLASTAATELDSATADGSEAARESMVDAMSMKSKAESIMPSHAREQQELHAQIEDLLVAIGEMQREHSQLAAMLQREREDRSEDHRTMRQLVGKLRKTDKEDRRRTMPVPPRARQELEVPPKGRPLSIGSWTEAENEAQSGKPKDEMEELVERMQERLQTNVRFSSSLETKAHLRTTLTRTREQLADAEAQMKTLTASLEVAEASVSSYQSESEDLRSEVKELRVRVADEYRARQKLEHQLSELKAQARTVDRKERLARAESLNEVPTMNRNSDGRKASMPSGGLRELRLGRRDSTSSVQSLRASRTPPLLQTDLSQSGSRFADSTSPSEGTPTSTPPRTTPDIVATPPSAVEPPSANGLSTKDRRGFSKRTSSLATQEVFATPQHESVPEEALLLELVNAKTSEAQARQEVDELRKALSVGRRKQDEALQILRAEMESAKADAAKAWEAAQAARAEAVRAAPSFNLPVTPYSEDANGGSGRSTAVTTPGEERSNSISVPKKTETPPSTVGGWFWGRRTASQTVNPPPVVKEGE